MKWLRRIGCLALLIVWFGLMLSPFFMFRLARNGQIEVRNTRIFQVQELDYQGIGIHTIRTARNNDMCEVHRLRYVMWEGAADNVHNCTCTDDVERVPSGLWSCVAP